MFAMRPSPQPGCQFTFSISAKRFLSQAVFRQLAINFVHRDEPLGRRTEHDRILASPTMRITVAILFRIQKRTRFAKKLNDLRIRIENILAGPMLDVRRESPRIIDRAIDLKAVRLPDVKVVGTMAGSRVDAARSRLRRPLAFKPDVKLDLGIGLTKRDVLAVHDQRRAIEPCVLCLKAIELCTFELRDLFVFGEPARLRKCLRQIRRDDEHLGIRSLDRRVIKIRMHGNAEIRGQSPWRRSPDDDETFLPASAGSISDGLDLSGNFT